MVFQLRYVFRPIGPTLQQALHGGHFLVVRYLVQQGADTEKADNHGFTPFWPAVSKGHAEVAAYLRSAGAR